MTDDLLPEGPPRKVYTLEQIEILCSEFHARAETLAVGDLFWHAGTRVRVTRICSLRGAKLIHMEPAPEAGTPS